MMSKGIFAMLDLGLDIRVALVSSERGAGFTATHALEAQRQVELVILEPTEMDGALA